MKKIIYRPNFVYGFKYLLLIIYFIGIFFYNYCYAQTDDLPISLSLTRVSYEKEKAIVILKFNIAENWKMYANIPGESGIPLKIKLKDANNIKSYQILWPQFKTSIYEGFSINYYNNEITIPIEIIPIQNDQEIIAVIHVDYAACKESCIRESKKILFNIPYGYFDEAGYALYQVALNVENSPDPSYSLLAILLFAMLGGFILNLMPCVLPVLSLKILSVMKNLTNDQRNIKISLLFTILGIIFSFIMLASLTQILKSFGHSLGWGFHFQEPIFIMFLITMLLLFASNLWGSFEIQLPPFLNRIFNYSEHTKSNILGSFFTGMFATLLATPCTAPFLSLAIAFGLSQSFPKLLLIYIFVGIGMALPFILLLIRPGLLRFLPKPGAWMIKLKKIFSVLLALTALWLFYVLSFQADFVEIFLFITLIILIKLIFTKNRSSLKAGAILVGVAILGYFASIYLSHSHNNELRNHVWESFSEEKVNEYIAKDYVVFIDITAEWCLTCKMNKFNVLEHDEIIKFLSTRNIKLLRADYTNKSDLISRFLKKYDRHGIPFNIIVSKENPNGIILPEILTKSIIYNEINGLKDCKQSDIPI
ncbi:protein-disulfide reductase DsbD family protein [Candidatus Jidaibacter acanthamoebae]|nr:thioredoxin family protein [Candidatus Jidaibacter acanthamoeba]